MDLSITFCRAIAALVITNAHFQHVYPWPILANGGLLGDVIFFAVSGYCIYEIRMPFVRWYVYRLMRIYPAVWLACLVFYRSEGVREPLAVFFYPTPFHFVGSIAILYAVYYAFFLLPFARRHVLAMVFLMLAGFAVYYVIGYDTSTYRIDNVRLWPIRVLFFAAMLLGAYARQQRGLFVGRLRLRHVVAVGVALPVYLISKLAFTRYPSLAPFQLVNWGALLVALAAIMRLMLGMEDRLARLPVAAISVVSSIARVTLEIYLVQYSLIPLLEGLGPFPLNFAVVCTGIGVSAYALHQIVDRRDSIVLRLWSRRRGAGAC